MTTPLTQLDAAMACLEKATPGPWVAYSRGSYWDGVEGSVFGNGGETDLDEASFVYPPGNANTIRGDVMHSDAEAMAIAVNFIRDHGPALRAALADAERYRHVRENPQVTQEEWEPLFLSPVEIDAAIDRAIAASKESSGV